MAISNKVGPPVTGDDFYGRTVELCRAHQYLDSNHSLVLSAPRRIGKSSFAKRLIDDKQSAGWKCVYIDLEGVQTRDEFLQILINKFDKTGIWTEATNLAGGILNKIFEGVKGIGPVKFDFSQSETSEKLYTSLAETIDHTKDTLIVIDELTLFLSVLDRKANNHCEIEFFLNWFRSLRQVSDSKIRWIFCGSVGLHNFTRMRNLSMTINDLLSFDFDALSEHEAKGLIMALAESENIFMSNEIITIFLEKLEWYIPYFIQLIFTNIKDQPDVRKEVTINMIDSAINKLAHTDELSTWSERLSEYNGQENGARLILKRLSQSNEGLSRDQLLTIYTQYTDIDPIKTDNELSLILNMLEHDGYIIRTEGGRRRFRSPLLKKWWHYKYVE
ncbi:MAG: AAA family ATPase [Muribaculaceae bacterium]|nr:AAA family ATPase [Muribaculaceae bacterium]